MKATLIRWYRSARDGLSRFRETPFGNAVTTWGSYLFQAGVIGVIVWQLTGIGWGNIWRSLPTTPLFYLLFLVIYFLLPLSEAFAYRICWGIPWVRSIPIFIKKRIFNKDVMGYSGEVVLMQWASRSLSASRREIFRDIRDMNIISSAASTIVAFGVLLLFILTGQIRALDTLFDTDFFARLGFLEYLAGGALAVLLLMLIYRFRRSLFSMSFANTAKIFLIHSVRMLILFTAQLLQWHLVLPEIALEIWFTFLSVQILMSRIPLIPSHELVATGTNIELAKAIGAPVAAVSSLFVVQDVLSKLLNLFFYLLYTWRERDGNSITSGREGFVEKGEAEVSA